MYYYLLARLLNRVVIKDINKQYNVMQLYKVHLCIRMSIYNHIPTFVCVCVHNKGVKL